ncbi:PQQ-binding-like beta-propeller repeat protein [Deinococcus sp. SDU3-2]|uniref:PQQ-binding-like beta-propeller repeat protein n=1 Tax=Deinococcus terrestris TaxID=2651870 RepID=A0A7X1NY86_9DEIO|nr:PQQ-binding-like beta-propeller repeat protein [Deinococcus terrestris]
MAPGQGLARQGEQQQGGAHTRRYGFSLPSPPSGKVTFPMVPACLRLALLALLLSGWGSTGGGSWPHPVLPTRVRPVVTSPAVPRVVADDTRVYLMADGQVRAYDPSLRTQLWAAPLKSFGGLAVGGGLVVADDGFTRLHAFDTRTGRRVWSAPAARALN